MSDLLHMARSRCIDAFAELEHEVFEMLRRSDKSVASKAALGCRLEALRKLQPSCHLSKAKHEQLPALCKRIEDMLPMRNALVHGVLRTANDGDDELALYTHPGSERSWRFTASFVLSRADHEKLRKRVTKTTEHLKRPSKG